MILVVGNINSGKSRTIEWIRKRLPEYQVLKIDEYRQLYGDGTTEKELAARERFVQDVIHCKNAIVELSGMGPLGKRLNEIMPPKQCILLHITASLDECLERLVKKDFGLIPYPVSEESLENTIRRLSTEFATGQLESLWSKKAVRIHTLINGPDLEQTIYEFPFRQYEKMIDVVAVMAAMPDVREIILYGSASRNEMRIDSDVDLMVSTNVTLAEMEHRLSFVDGVTYVDTPDGKVTLYFDDLLVEVVVVGLIRNHAKYYCNSYPGDIEMTILKGESGTLIALSELVEAFRPSRETMIDETIKRLLYFVISLKEQMNRNDTYKFFFHNNIIIHEVLRLERLFKNDLRFNYLPKNLFSTTSIPISNLVFSFDCSMEKHIWKVKKTISDFFEENGILTEGQKHLLK